MNERDDDECVDCAEPDHFGPTGNSTTTKPWDGSPSRFTDAEYKMSSAACNNSGKPPKSDCFLPHHEPGGTVNVNGVHAAAGRVSALKGQSAAAVGRAKAHLRGHYKALKEDPPPSIAASGAVSTVGDCEDCPEMAHTSMSGTHSHEHSAYGAQGGDQTHSHQHTHSGDSRHDHHRQASIVGMTVSTDRYPAGVLSFTASAAGAQDGLVVSGDATKPDDQGSLLDMMGSLWGVLQGETGRWAVLTASGATWEGNPPNPPEGGFDADGKVSSWSPPGYQSYTEAVAAIAEQMAISTDDRPVLSTTWKSEMAYEDKDTGDGRYIKTGAIEYRACPMPLMLQTQTAGGHQGAVLAGSIEETGKLGLTALGSGTYDATEAGRQAAQIVAARGRFGVSIDVAEAEGEVVCTKEDDDGYCMDGRIEFSLIRVMGLTMTPFPAFEDAYIESVASADAQAASAAPVQATADHITDRYANSNTAANVTLTLVNTANTTNVVKPVVAAAYPAPARPPKAWFDDPGFTVGDGRLVRQDDGQQLCPLTVTPDGEVYGHFAGWMSCHTGYTNTCMRPPRSRTGYAAFHLRPLETAEGDIVTIGHISMGMGHIEDDGTVPVDVVRAFYDGGPGAVQVARVRVGEDQFGGWFHGALAEGLTDVQVRKFSQLSVSGHWKEAFTGRGLDLIACAAGITVPGFIVQAMAAAGYCPVDVDAGYRLPEPHAAFRDGRVVALVASGVVRQPLPWERMVAEQAARVDRLEHRLAAAELVTGQLRAQVAQKLRAATLPAPVSNGS